MNRNPFKGAKKQDFFLKKEFPESNARCERLKKSGYSWNQMMFGGADIG